MPFYRPVLEQIEGATRMREELNALIESYEAARVITTKAKTDADQGKLGAAVYNVDEAVAELFKRIKDLNQIQNESAALVNNRLKAFEDKVVKDIVRIQLDAQWVSDHFSIHAPANFATLVPEMDTAVLLPAYYPDNTPVLGSDGQQIQVQYTNGSFSFIGTVAELDEVASARTTDGSKVYKPKQASFTCKIFPVGTFSLKTLPDAYLVDNAELQTIAYQEAINKLAVQLAKDSDLIDAIKAMIGTETVKKQIENEDAALRAVIQANAETAKADLSGTAADIRAHLVNKPDIFVPHTQVFELTDAASDTFVLDLTPNEGRITININGLVYEEEADVFTVDREKKTLRWIATKENGGFDLTTEIASKIVVRYTTRGLTEQEAEAGRKAGA